MSKMRIRAIKDMVKKANLEFVTQRVRGSGHLDITVRTFGGARSNFIFSMSPSDYRSDLNKMSIVRRWAQGVQDTAGRVR